MDYKRLALNLIFFWLGILLPLLAFQSAFAATWTYTGLQRARGPEWACGGWVSGIGYTTEPVANSQMYIAYQYPGEDWVKSSSSTSVSGGYIWGKRTGSGGGCALYRSFDYVPPPSEPEHCSNGVQDGDETGIDCGGSCPDICGDITCPGGYIPLYYEDTITGCAREGAQDKFGNCGAGFFYDSSTEICVALDQVTAPISYGESYTPPELDPVPIGAPGTFSVTHFVGGETVVDNGDGTETATIDFSSTDSDGNTKNGNASVTRPLGSESGTGFQRGSNGDNDGGGYIPIGVAPGYQGQSQSDESTDPEEDPGNYDYQLEDAEYDGEISSDDIPEKESLTDLFNGYLANNPVVSTITGSGIVLESEVTQLTWTYPATGKLVVFDLSDRNDVLSTIGFILVFLSGISAYFIIVGRQ